MCNLPEGRECPLLKESSQPGATGEYPQGMLNPDDEGALKIAVSEEKGNVAIHFGKPVSWLAMSPQQIRDFAITLLRMATKIDGVKVTISLGI